MHPSWEEQQGKFLLRGVNLRPSNTPPDRDNPVHPFFFFLNLNVGVVEPIYTYPRLAYT